jgi:alkylated DNA repair protein (DNA oxidative demethylase)
VSEAQAAFGFAAPERAEVLPGAVHLPGFADPAALRASLEAVLAAAPLRTMHVPSGAPMSVTMTNCGAYGWVTDRRGYRYEACDPLTGAPWPAIPADLARVATAAAAAGGFPDFVPDACLVNRYEPGAKMGFHQDRDEADLAGPPIVTLSFGIPARFAIRPAGRSSGPSLAVTVRDGDAFVMGGPSRLAYHAIRPVPRGDHPVWEAARLSWTFRRAR